MVADQNLPAFLKISVDKSVSFGIMVTALEGQAHTADWCNGSTPDSDSVCEGSNPSSAAK